MQINPIPAAATITSLVNQITSKLDPRAYKAATSPNLSMSPAQINRSYEMSKDPPVTILKYTNSVTHEIELQVPSEESIRLYRDMGRFIAQHSSKPDSTVNIIV